MTKITELKPGDAVFPSAADDARVARVAREHPSSHRLAYCDADFMHRDELRAARLQLEWLKPDLIQADCGIESTVVIFGGARYNPEDMARQKVQQAREALAQAPADRSLIRQHQVAEARLGNSHFYEQTRALARQITQLSLAHEGREFVVVTGGGPGLMEAANRGAVDAGGKSIGLNIVLPFEQVPNAYITPDLCFQFHYFAIRKMHFLKRARGLVACPGGFGTLDELFDALTLVQTKKIKPLPIVLLGKRYWQRLIDFDFLLEQGAIEEEDLELFHIVDSGEEAWAVLQQSWGLGES